MKPILMTICMVAMTAAGAQAETVKSGQFMGEITRHAVKMQPRDGSGAPLTAVQAWVSVTTLSGAVPVKAQMQAAGVFAAKAGCGQMKPLSAIAAGVSADAAEFEILCKGNQ